MSAYFKIIPFLLAAFSTITLVSNSAGADVVVGVRAAKYGEVIVSGHPNVEVQTDTTFSVRAVTVGSKSADGGTIDGQPINEKVRLRAGQYEITYSGTTSTLEVVAGKTTVVKLQRVFASPFENTRTVVLLTGDNVNDEDCTPIGMFVRKTKKRIFDSAQSCPPLLRGITCNSSYHYDDIVRSWKSAYFYVLPGTYSMRWNLEDGTRHQEDKIIVQ